LQEFRICLLTLGSKIRLLCELCDLLLKFLFYPSTRSMLAQGRPLTNEVAACSSATRRSGAAFALMLRTRARASAGARSGVPASKGGAGAYSRPNCMD
jgi:hypothetical protein